MRLAVALSLMLSSCAAPQLRTDAQPAAAGLAEGIAAADSIVRDAIGRVAPGAVLLVSHHGRIVHEKAYGHAELKDYDMRDLASPVPMRTSTMFDLASVTKVLGTTFAIMILVDRGVIDIDSPVHAYLPDFRGAALDSITVRHLLSHSSGIAQWQPLYYQAATPSETYKAIREMPPQWGIGESRHYSDLGFMLLGYIVERMSGRRLDAFLHRELYHPLGLAATSFNPRDHGFTEFAATEAGNGYERQMVHDPNFGYEYRGDPASWNGWRQYVLSGEVNDGNAWHSHQGIAGHAGLFSTARDVGVLVELMNARGSFAGRRYLSESVVDRFLTLDRYGHYLGWQRPPDMPAGSFAHTGFTGTWVLGVPRYGLGITLLTNRQNLGRNEQGFFPDAGPLRAAVAAALLKGVTATGGRSGNE